MVSFIVVVYSVYLCLHLFHIFLGDGRLVAVVVEEHGEYVFHSFALRVTHGIHGSVGTFGYQLMLQSVALSVAAYDAANLPEAEVIEEFTAGDAYLAHEQLVDVVGVA